LVAAAIIPIAIYILVKANATLAGIAILLAFAAWIVALVIGRTGHGKERAFAAGALVAFTIYAGLVLSEGKFSLTRSMLPTSGLLYYAHEACVVRTMTEVEILSPGTALLSPPVPGTAMMMTDETPTPENFAIVGHVYWGLFFATLCGWLACWLAKGEPTLTALRRTSESDATQTAR
jgi:hypothetical protein